MVTPVLVPLICGVAFKPLREVFGDVGAVRVVLDDSADDRCANFSADEYLDGHVIHVAVQAVEVLCVLVYQRAKRGDVV